MISNNSQYLGFEGGGPYDGQEGLFEHDGFDHISVQTDSASWTYSKIGSRR